MAIEGKPFHHFEELKFYWFQLSVTGIVYNSAIVGHKKFHHLAFHSLNGTNDVAFRAAWFPAVSGFNFTPTFSYLFICLDSTIPNTHKTSRICNSNTSTTPGRLDCASSLTVVARLHKNKNSPSALEQDIFIHFWPCDPTTKWELIKRCPRFWGVKNGAIEILFLYRLVLGWRLQKSFLRLKIQINIDKPVALNHRKCEFLSRLSPNRVLNLGAPVF